MAEGESAAVGLLIEKAFSECERIDRAFSRFREGNELAELNAGVGEWMEVGEELFKLLLYGERLKEESEGAFDLTVCGVLEGWGYDKEYSFEAGEKGRCGTVELRNDGQVRVTAPVDLGGIGKGYALERMVEVMKEGCEKFLVDAGGDIYATESRVAFEHPMDKDSAIGVVNVQDFYLASSSGNRRQWSSGGQERHHLVNVDSGEPARGMLAVYTQGKSGMVVDGWATALFVMGYEKAKERAGKCPVEFMLVSVAGEIFKTEGFKGELFSEG